MPVKTVISPCSAPQVTFRQATRGVSNENGLCQARHGTCRSCLSSLLFLPHQDERSLHFPNWLLFALVCGMIAILISIFKQYLKNADSFCIYIQRDQFASETPHAAKTVHVVSKTLLLLLWYALTLTALLLQSQENFLVFSKQTFCSFQTTSREPNWQRFIPRAMQCVSQLITKEQTHLSKI